MMPRHLILGLLLAGNLIGNGYPAHAQSSEERMAPWAHHIDEAAHRFGVPRGWIEAVILAESGGRTTQDGHPITSPKGAMGLMQLMPGTYADMRKRHGLGQDPHDPRDNILAGTAYLREMFDRFGYPGLFAAYNAGPATYSASLSGRTLPAETRTYMARVTRTTAVYRPVEALFVDRSASARPDRSTGLFVPLRHASAPEY